MLLKMNSKHKQALFVSFLALFFWQCRTTVNNSINATENKVSSSITVSSSSGQLSAIRLGGTNSRTMYGTYGNQRIFATASQVIIPDTANHRVLIFNGIPTSTVLRAPDVVLGQINSTETRFAISSVGMNWPTAVCMSGTKLFILDSRNHRVLLWKSEFQPKTRTTRRPRRIVKEP
jgi:hypothetical protein